MIIVIADDITGAAELAGIGLRYGLRVKLAADIKYHDQTDLLVVYTNTRSMQKAGAVNEMKQLSIKAGKLNPSIIYKKTDSVLRGHVIPELEAQMEVLGFEKALLVPANPGLGRTIENGRYYVNGKPLHETEFSADPEFPVKTSDIKELLTGKTNISVKKPGSSLMPGVNVGETQSEDDMVHWAGYQNENVLLAGGGFFFDVLLSQKYARKESSTQGTVGYPLLFVIGTAFQKHGGRLKELDQMVSTMPADLFSDKTVNEEAIIEWGREVVSLITKYNKAFIVMGGNEKGDSELLRKKITGVVKLVMEKVKIHELIIEGGSTAYSIVTELNWQQFIPVEEQAYGVVKMKVENGDDIFLTIKPGSYPWPPIWDFS